MIEEYLLTGEKVYVALMILEKAYDGVDREALWNFPKIYDVGEQ